MRECIDCKENNKSFSITLQYKCANNHCENFIKVPIMKSTHYKYLNERKKEIQEKIIILQEDLDEVEYSQFALLNP